MFDTAPWLSKCSLRHSMSSPDLSSAKYGSVVLGLMRRSWSSHLTKPTMMHIIHGVKAYRYYAYVMTVSRRNLTVVPAYVPHRNCDNS